MFKDPILNKLIKDYGPPPNRAERSEFLYEEIIESIIGQQLSGKAADTIFNRFLSLYKEKKFPRPKALIKTDTEKLRGAGMSYGKAAYIKNVAQAFLDKTIDVEKLRKMNDEEVITELTKIKGVGRWTAEMILIFTFKRTDVFSMGDAGLRRAIKNLYKLEKEVEILKLAEKWKPNRSLACWYLWRSLENR
ncbi:MAG: hypothetical protein A3B38_00990 [Candidatus Levybacteria bacterium RIFCSPLOWO2_01_FULL_36_13]|nr:MAG: hypothetical protein A2684_02230 [Candidatus Levybacteria bacterium RIFCSPHIGHO2_01_FULL_36_15b]OGH35463.1 MAG: hypothetical protein A3B38_00990 [Candidatus Levybacteria bacterium RIFCSPLOWO2_01_FULL_36_13]